MFSDLWDDIFSPFSTLRDRCLALLISAIMLMTILVSIFLILMLVDQVGVTANKTATTVVAQKQVVPAHTSTTFVAAGKVTIPTITYHPEKYRIHFKISDVDTSMDVQNSFFQNILAGDQIQVRYGRGRLSGTIVPTQITLIER